MKVINSKVSVKVGESTHIRRVDVTKVNGKMI